MNHVFKIDTSKIHTLKKRLLLKGFFWSLLYMPLVIFPQYLRWGEANPIVFLFTTIAVLLTVFIPIYIGTNKNVKGYVSMEIVFGVESVEMKAENMPYKSINWDDLIFKEKSNGEIDIYDKNISFFDRRFNGVGCIKIPPEISDRNGLISVLNSHS